MAAAISCIPLVPVSAASTMRLNRKAISSEAALTSMKNQTHASADMNPPLTIGSGNAIGEIGADRANAVLYRHLRLGSRIRTGMTGMAGGPLPPRYFL